MASFLTAEWRYLLMLNYAIEASVVEPYVPRGTELDTWQGTTFLSIVGFQFRNTRVLGLPIPWHRHFEEVNLRFYVRRPALEGWRRGVVFIKEIVPRLAIATVARSVYNEPYDAFPMKHRVDLTRGALASGGTVSYAWRRGERWHSISAIVSEPARPVDEGSEAQFITEHYWGYTARRSGGTAEYQVEHPPWQVADVRAPTLDCDVATVYGPQFVEALAGPPASAFIADGSPIVVHRGSAVAETTGA